MQALCQHRCPRFFGRSLRELTSKYATLPWPCFLRGTDTGNASEMRTALRVTAGMDNSQSVELRDRCGMEMTISARQQCWIAPAGRAMTSQAEIAHFVGWVERSKTHHLAARMMGIAALTHPTSGHTRKARTANAQIQIVRLLSCSTHFGLNPDIAPRPLRVPRAERFRYAAIVQQPSP